LAPKREEQKREGQETKEMPKEGVEGWWASGQNFRAGCKKGDESGRSSRGPRTKGNGGEKAPKGKKKQPPKQRQEEETKLSGEKKKYPLWDSKMVQGGQQGKKKVQKSDPSFGTTETMRAKGNPH